MNKLYIIILLLIVSANVFCQSGSEHSIDMFFKKAEANNFSGNVLVAQNGKIILKKGYGLRDREVNSKENGESVFDIGSITKQFTGAGILKLEMEGKLNVQDALKKYFPNVPEDKKNITLHQLLTHSAGFPGALGDDFNNISTDDFITLAFNEQLLFKPGSQYEYSNVGFSILAIIIEKVSGKSYEAYLHDAIFVPAGMLHTGYIIPQYRDDELSVGYREDGSRWGTMPERYNAVSPGWNLKGNGGILTTLDDMYNWYLALQGNTILNADAKEKYFEPHIKEYENGNTYYGYGWVIEQRLEGKFIWHNGGNGVSLSTFMGFNQQTQTCIIVNVNVGGKVSDDYAIKCLDIMNGLNASLDSNVNMQYAGKFLLNKKDTIQVHFDEFDRLITEYTSPEVFQLLLLDGTEKAPEIENYNNKTKNMLEALFTKDYTLIAKAWDMDAKEFEDNAGKMWQNQAEESGGFDKIQIIGTAARRGANAFITVANIKFKQNSVYMMYVWRGDNLVDARDINIPNKVFDWENNTTFSAANNNKKMVLEKGNIKVISELGMTILTPLK